MAIAPRTSIRHNRAVRVALLHYGDPGNVRTATSAGIRWAIAPNLTNVVLVLSGAVTPMAVGLLPPGTGVGLADIQRSPPKACQQQDQAHDESQRILGPDQEGARAGAYPSHAGS
jgi:hypothetical protein